MNKGDIIRVLNALDAAASFEAAVLDLGPPHILVRVSGTQGVLAFDSTTGVGLTGNYYIEL